MENYNTSSIIEAVSANWSVTPSVMNECGFRRRGRSWSVAVALSLVLLYVAPPTTAQVDVEQLSTEAAEHARSGTPDELRRAIEKYGRVLALRRSAHSAGQEADTLFAIASAYEKLGEIPKAREFYLEALCVYEAAGDVRGQADAALNAGVLSYVVGEPRVALDYLNRALPLWHQLDVPAKEARTASNLGIVHFVLGNLPEALEWYTRALPLRRAAGDVAGEAATLHNIGLVHEELGDPQLALEFVARARTLCRTSGQRVPEAGVLNTLGGISLLLGEPHNAIEYFGAALAIGRAENNRGVLEGALGGLAETRTQLGEYDAALSDYLEALTSFRISKYQRGEARTLVGLGGLYERLGRRREALESYEAALRIFRAIREPVGEARALAVLGEMHARSGAGAQAFDEFSESLTIARRVGDSNSEATALVGLARVERDRGDVTSARTRLEAALTLIESRRARLKSDEHRAGFLGTRRSAYELYVDILMRLAEQESTARYAAAALEASERSRARSLLDLLAEARVDVRSGIDPSLKQRERALDGRISQLQKRLIELRSRETPDAAEVATAGASLQAAENDRRELEWEIRRSNPRYAGLRYPETLRTEAIQRDLDPDTALLEYLVGVETSWLFVVTSTDVRVVRLPGASEIASLVTDVRAGLERPGRRETGRFTRAARRLFELLVAPAEQVIKDKSLLLVAADRDLHFLPFEVLIGSPLSPGPTGQSRGVPYLLRRWAVSYVPSASVLADLATHRKPTGPTTPTFVGFGDPTYQSVSKRKGGTVESEPEKQGNSEAVRSLFDSSGRLTLPRLEGSGREVTSIAARFRKGEATVYLGHEAREENVKGNPLVETAQFLHFAVHGVVDDKRPWYSGLILSLDGVGDEDGLLQIHEIYDLKIDADLVVLSACRSGLGREVTGEGILGLARAFLYAGASSAAVSLWQVSDRSTADLMVAFYEALDGGAGKAEALRQAKLRIIESGRDAHPYYWAPFIIVGSPE